MKYIYSFALFIFFTLVAPAFAAAEYIESFESLIEINADGTFEVTESIEYVFTEERHGIFRYIPTEHPQKPSAWYKDRYTLIDVTGVTIDGGSVPYELTKESDRIFLRIGDPDSTIVGSHAYEIQYRVSGGLLFHQNSGAELYWNVTGTEWDVPMKRVEVMVTAPDGMLTGERACYYGAFGESDSCSNSVSENNEHRFVVTNLPPGEGVTVALAVDGSAVERVVLEKNQMIFLWTALILMWLTFLSYFVYRHKTKYRTGRSVIAQYEPYEDFKPMYTGLLFDGALNPEDITACIVYLAEQGFLKIKKTSGKVLFFIEVDDYEVTLQRSPSEIETRFQREVLHLLFGDAPLVGTSATLSKLKHDTSKQQENQKILLKLKADLAQDLRDSGFFQSDVSAKFLLTAAMGVAGAGIILWVTIDTFFPVGFAIFCGVVLASIVILSFGYRRRTRKGYEALDHLEGFREFLSVTEKDRYTFHNAPKKNPEQFMAYLPYAIAFGVEEEWAEVFKDITIPNPEWYDGGSTGYFGATNLTTSLGAFSTAFASSSGTSGSASSGGGSVGGGGGGGGGGSW